MPRHRANLHKLNQCSLWSLPPFTSIKSPAPANTISSSCAFFPFSRTYSNCKKDRVKTVTIHIPWIKKKQECLNYSKASHLWNYPKTGNVKLQSKYHKWDTERSTSMMTGAIIQHEMWGEIKIQPTHHEPTISSNEMSYCSSARQHFYKRHH